MDRVEVERRLRDFFAADQGLAAIYLFGSTASGADRDDSDVDVGVLFRTAPRSTLDDGPFDLEDRLERLLGRPVDLTVLNVAPVDLRARVLREGRLVLDADPSARIAFEVRTRNEAFDLEPILREYRTPRRTRA